MNFDFSGKLRAGLERGKALFSGTKDGTGEVRNEASTLDVSRGLVRQYRVDLAILKQAKVEKDNELAAQVNPLQQAYLRADVSSLDTQIRDLEKIMAQEMDHIGELSRRDNSMDPTIHDCPKCSEPAVIAMPAGTFECASCRWQEFATRVLPLPATAASKRAWVTNAKGAENSAGDTFYCPKCRAVMSEYTMGVHNRANPDHSVERHDANGNLTGAVWAKENAAGDTKITSVDHGGPESNYWFKVGGHEEGYVTATSLDEAWKKIGAMYGVPNLTADEAKHFDADFVREEKRNSEECDHDYDESVDAFSKTLCKKCGWRRYIVSTEEFPNVPEIASRYFPGFNLSHSTGYYKGQQEPSDVITITGPDTPETKDKVDQMAYEIKETNHQETVLIEEQEVAGRFNDDDAPKKEDKPIEEDLNRVVDDGEPLHRDDQSGDELLPNRDNGLRKGSEKYGGK